jgi:hypothetical protein
MMKAQNAPQPAAAPASNPTPANVPPAGTATVSINLPPNVSVTSSIQLRINATQYIPVTIKHAKPKEVEVLPNSIKNIDFFCIQLDPNVKIPPGHLKCKLGSTSGGYIPEVSSYRDIARKEEKKEEKKEERREEKEREKENLELIDLTTDLVIIGRSLIRQVGGVNSVTFYNEHDEDVDVTIYVGYDTSSEHWR